MKRKRLIGLVGLAMLVAVVAVLALRGRRPEWTTSSPQALSEFRQGLEALDKVYRAESTADFAKAVELDPKFLAAKYFLLRSLATPSSDPQAAKLYAELEAADLANLTARERFLIRYALAAHAKDAVKAGQILQAYAVERPDDPYALDALATDATARQDWPQARRLLTRLIEVAPNRVSAYNQLGYLAMGQGQFAEAEKMFETYRYIAPDQANPHDSLGELDILTGRYADARKELDEALRIRPDFCASSGHLVSLALLEGKTDEARQALAQAEGAGGCPAYMDQMMKCAIAVWTPFSAGDWNGVWQARQGACADDDRGDSAFMVWAALRTGHTSEADALIAKAGEQLAKLPPASPGRRYLEAEVAHLEGARFLVEGEPAKAAERFRFADQAMSYRELGPGLFKLINRFVLAQALSATGARDEAAAVLAEARAVNAKFIDRLGALLAPGAAR
ncbi:MAG: tetratricopeptide repeat protein [Thermoanaerobaculaceae bacterium]|nr:tetratricopeptide repeat protein [Thermoanaerobaculaceae bacterium]